MPVWLCIPRASLAREAIAIFGVLGHIRFAAMKRRLPPEVAVR